MGKENRETEREKGSHRKNVNKQKYKFILKEKEETGRNFKIQHDFGKGFQGKEYRIKECYPTFLQDKNHKTPSFVVPYFIHPQFPLQQLKQLSYFQSQSQQSYSPFLNHPAPLCNKGLCKVCRYYFDNYLAHIETDRHMRNIMLSPFTEEIKKFCEEKYGQQSREKDLISKIDTTQQEAIKVQDPYQEL